MFNKREMQETSESERTASPADSSAQQRPRESVSARAQAAVIGPSITIDGELKGEEDLIVEGRIKGTVSLRQHTLTIGQQGTVDAEIYAATILVDGTVNGDLYAAERISVRKSARIEGKILAPRISLEDGAKFRGSIDMDPESEALRKAFGRNAASGADRPPAESAGSPQKDSGKSASVKRTAAASETKAASAGTGSTA